MGRSTTPKYHAHYRDQSGWHDIGWDCRRDGVPSDIAAEEFRKRYNKSFQPGGVNGHLSEQLGYIPHISEVRVVRNDGSNRLVASATAPNFEVT